MKLKVYLGDWFYNAGIVGFCNIFKNKDKLKINENYLEFESEDLIGFADEYFDYFFDKYNVAKKVLSRIEKNFSIIKNNLEDEKDKSNEIVKNNKKYAKETLKRELAKIKKFDESAASELENAINSLDSIKEKEQIEELDNVENTIKNCLEKKEVNERLTMNLFKSILSNSYFGQVSLLNVVKSSLSYEEQKKILYKDYISNIVETDFLQKIINNVLSIEEIEKILKEKDMSLLTKEFNKIYENILKLISKGKQLDDIKNYINNKASTNCEMCENEHVLTSNYSEGNFISLAVSSDNMSNFFWNQNTNFPICDVCKLILFCIPAGVTSIIKTIKENGEYKEKDIYSFINYDTSINELLSVNNDFKNKSKKERMAYNPYAEIIMDIVGQSKSISEWKLQNIFVVEFEAEYLAFSRLEYFNITRFLAIFFTRYAEKSLNKIYDYKYRLQLVDYALKNKDIKLVINEKLRDNFKNEIYNNLDSYYASKMRMDLNLIKKGENEMSDTIENGNKKLGIIFNIGVGQRERMKSKGQVNKLNGYIYKMLNCIKQGNRTDFLDIVIRLNLSIEERVPKILIDAIENENLDFNDVAQSYLSGLVSDRYEGKNDEGGENNE